MIPFLMSSAILLIVIFAISVKAILSVHQYFFFNISFILVSLLILIGSIHNTFYTWNGLYYRYKNRLIYKNKEKLTLLKLKLTKQRSIAVFIPAWKESDVIDKMVENILEKADYSNYTVFVGTYPNDLETQASVDLVSKRYPNIIKVVTKTPGPTSKSDCLNNVYEQMLQYEATHNIYFDTIILHDAEDVVHPYEFLLANYFLLTADALQMPILPLPTSLLNVVHWIYADEFASFQMRDSFVRENTGGFVPFAGVGMCLTRRALAQYQESFQTTPFPESSLTEDYLLASRMRQLGLKVYFLKVTLQDEYLDTSRKKILSKRSYFISNWAYFPMNFKRSVRQKTRWMTGIVFQGWEELGWKGSLTIKENLLKDRRLVFDQIANLGTLLIFTYFVLLLLSDHQLIPFHIVNVLDQNIYISILFWLTLVMMIKDMLEKFIIVSSIYGLLQGILSLPRTLVANIINGLAAFNAVKTYLLLRKGSQVKWDKTAHLEGVGSIPSDVQQVTGQSSKTILKDDDIAKFLSDSYESQLKTAKKWDINQLSAEHLSDRYFTLTDQTPEIKKVLLSLLLNDIPNIKEQNRIIHHLLQSDNISVINNCLEYLYETSQLEKYHLIFEEDSCLLSKYMRDELLRNRENNFNISDIGRQIS